MTEELTASTLVAIANGSYAALPSLPSVVPDVTAITILLESRHGFAVTLLDDRRRSALVDALEDALPERRYAGGALIVLWAGHGTLTEDQTLQLWTRKSDGEDAVAAQADELTRLAARTGARQILLILDTCYSGDGATEAADVAAAVLRGRADVRGLWFGVVAAARPAAKALAGQLPQALNRLLTDGPTDDIQLLRWDPRRARVSGADLIDALLAEWPDERPLWHHVLGNRPLDLIANPRAVTAAPSQVVEHLLQAARGTSGDADFFTGRVSQLRAIVSWLGESAPGLCVVSGPAGCGKSGLVGRLVSLSVPQERARLAPTPVDLDPGESSVSAHAHVRGLRWSAVLETIAVQLGLDRDAGIFDLLARASHARRDGRPLLVVLDGLDEAGETEARDIAIQLVAPLAAEARVIVGTRNVANGPGQPDLLTQLGPTRLALDLGSDPAGLRADVRAYVIKRLTGVFDAMDPRAVADELFPPDAPELESPFLLARLVTSQLRAVPISTAEPDWPDRMASSVEAALEDDLTRTVLEIDGRPHPTAARDLLRGLACAYGRGMPPQEIWPAAATALSPTGTQYTAADAYRLLTVLGRHVVSDLDGDEQVYRIAHQRLIDHLRPTIGRSFTRILRPEAALPLATAFDALYRDELADGLGEPVRGYLWRYLWRHCADAGEDGLALLRRLVELTSGDFENDLALALALCGNRAYTRSKLDAAIACFAEAAEIRRRIGSPAELAGVLFDLADAQGLTGNVHAARITADEAAEAAQRASAETGGSVVARAMLSRAMSSMGRGQNEAALGHLRQAMGLLDEAEDRLLLGAVCASGAMAATNLGDGTSADELSRRAVELFEAEFGATSTEPPLRYALWARAAVEWQSRIGSFGETRIDQTHAAERIVTLHRDSGATDSVSDLITANGLAFLVRQQIVESAQADRPIQSAELEALLDEAVRLAQPLAPQNAEAVLLLGQLHAYLAVTNLGDPTEQFDAAEAMLERPAAEMPAAAVILAGVLVARVQRALRDGPLSEADYQRLIRAVGLLGALRVQYNQERGYLDALRLLFLQSLIGNRAETDPALAAIVAVLRDQLTRDDAVLEELAGAVAEQAARQAARNPVEAIRAAHEALAWLERVPSSRSHDLLRAKIQANLVDPYIMMARLDDARQAADTAVVLADRVDPAADPYARAVCGFAHVAKSALAVRAGDYATARDNAEQALQLLDGSGQVSPLTVPAVHLFHGRAIVALGDDVRGWAEVESAVDALLLPFDGSVESITNMCGAVESAGPECWELVLDRFAEQPDLRARLGLFRTAPSVEAVVEDLTAGLAKFVEDGLWTRIVRQRARIQRRGRASAFDAAWRASTGTLPDWLLIDPLLDPAVRGWLSCVGAVASQGYLLNHPEICDEATNIILDELAGEFVAGAANDEHANIDDWQRSLDGLTAHRRILADAAASGIEAAYRTLIGEEILTAWAESADLGSYLATHRDELLGPAVTAALAIRDFIGDTQRAMVDLLRRGEESVVRQLLDRPSSGLPLLPTALESNDPERLRSLSLVILSQVDQGLAADSAATATAYWAASEALLGSSERAAAVLEPPSYLRPEDDPGPVLRAARSAHPESAPAVDYALEMFRRSRDAAGS